MGVPVKLVFDGDKLIFCPEQSLATLLVFYKQQSHFRASPYELLIFDFVFQTSLSDEILGYPNLSDLGVTPAAVTERMPNEMHINLKCGYWQPLTADEEPEPEPPTPLTRIEEKSIISGNKVGLLQQFGIA